jgi:hypothetical protein
VKKSIGQLERDLLQQFVFPLLVKDTKDQSTKWFSAMEQSLNIAYDSGTNQFDDNTLIPLGQEILQLLYVRA